MSDELTTESTAGEAALTELDLAVVRRLAASRGWVGGDVVTALADEVERLRRWKAEALPVIDGLQDVGHALGLPLGTRITGPEAAEKARAFVAQIEKVRALHVNKWVVIREGMGGFICAECLEPVESEPCATIRALDGPE